MITAVMERPGELLGVDPPEKMIRLGDAPVLRRLVWFGPRGPDVSIPAAMALELYERSPSLWSLSELSPEESLLLFSLLRDRGLEPRHLLGLPSLDVRPWVLKNSRLLGLNDMPPPSPHIIQELLSNLDHNRLHELGLVVAGGQAAIVYAGDAYRDSFDVDFLTSDGGGYAKLREDLHNTAFDERSIGGIFSASIAADIRWVRDIQRDATRVSCVFEFRGEVVKLEICRENRITLEVPDAGPSLISWTDLVAEKILACTDRGGDPRSHFRDSIDLAFLLDGEDIPLVAIGKAERAYGPTIHRALLDATLRLGVLSIPPSLDTRPLSAMWRQALSALGMRWDAGSSHREALRAKSQHWMAAWTQNLWAWGHGISDESKDVLSKRAFSRERDAWLGIAQDHENMHFAITAALETPSPTWTFLSWAEHAKPPEEDLLTWVERVTGSFETPAHDILHLAGLRAGRIKPCDAALPESQRWLLNLKPPSPSIPRTRHDSSSRLIAWPSLRKPGG